MIEINLLPQELRIKEKTAKFEIRNLLYLLPMILAVLLLFHLYFLISDFALQRTYKILKNKLIALEPKKKELEKIALTGDDLTIRQFVKERVNWAEKLNTLSARVPSGIWFNELSLSDKDFSLKCSVFSLEKQEMSLINKFLNGLKEEKNFIGDFKNLEIGPAQRETIGSYDILKFTLNGKIK